MPNFREFLTQSKVRLVNALATSAGTDVESDILDMQGFLGVVFFTTIATKDVANFIKIQQGDDIALSDAADLEGSAVVALVNADIVATEVFRPTQRYVRAVIDRGGTNTATGEIWAIQYGANLKPVDNNEASIIVSGVVSSPDEGTA